MTDIPVQGLNLYLYQNVFKYNMQIHMYLSPTTYLMQLFQNVYKYNMCTFDTTGPFTNCIKIHIENVIFIHLDTRWILYTLI